MLLLYANISVKSIGKSEKSQIFFGQFGCPDFLYYGGIKEAHTMYERLLACGYPAELARDIVAQTDPADLERCVRMIELLYDDRREYV